MEENQEQEMPVKTKRDAFLEYAGSKFEGFNPEDEDGMYGSLMDYMTKNDEANSKLVDALESDPRLAQIMVDVVNKKRGALAAMARYMGKEALSAEGEAADEIEAAEQERQQELEREKASAAEYAKNLEESVLFLESAAEEAGMSVEDWLDKVYNQIVAPIFDGKYTKEVCDRLTKALTYDNDVKEAFEAGKVKTRNEKIDKMKRDVGDGLPKIGPNGGAVEEVKKPEKRFNVREGSVWNK